MTLGSHFRLIEHTADMGIEAWADSREKVLEEIARGLATVIYGDRAVAVAVEAEIVVRAGDPVELLVGWLNEVAYWCEKNAMVPATFAMEAVSDNELQATIAGEPFTPGRHAVERQVKSVTYHQACLEKTREGWHARVYVDL